MQFDYLTIQKIYSSKALNVLRDKADFPINVEHVPVMVTRIWEEKDLEKAALKILNEYKGMSQEERDLKFKRS